MSSHSSHKPIFTSYSPYNPVNQPPVTSDYAIDSVSQPISAKISTEKMSAHSIHELQPLAGGDSLYGDKQKEPTEEAEDSPYKMVSRKERNRIIIHAVRFVATTVLVSVLLAIPLFVLNGYADVGDSTDDNLQKRNAVYWGFAWVLVSWIIGCFFHFIALILPYVFWIVAKFVNPAHRRYWRVFRPLRLSITLLGGLIGSIITFDLLLFENGYVALNNTEDPTAIGVFTVIYSVVFDIQNNLLMWVLMYLAVKIVVIYISVHYHYRSDGDRIEKSKNIMNALSALYETSIYLDPIYSKRFQTEDLIIRNASLSGNGKRQEAAKFFQRIGGISTKAISMFGNAIGSEGKSHWFKAASTYATIERALGSPKSAAALAQRIWTSIASEGKDVLTADDIAEALGPHRKEDAKQIFDILDENENGDIQLDEMVQLLVEASKNRSGIYQGMVDINHAINTFEWVLLILIGVIVIALILLNWFPPVQKLKDILGFSALGLSFALGRTVNDFIGGANFVFFKHAFDVGDRVDLFNGNERNFVAVNVKRINLLYCIFERCDDGKTVQFPTLTLNAKRIENITRSGLNREKVTLYIDINTSFKDVEYLRSELKSFLSSRENARDYKPDLALRVKSVHELNKLELAVVFSHKSNWSNEGLRSARSSKFMCALIAALRRVPIQRPGPPPPKLGSEDRPNYTVMITDAEAAEMRAADERKGKKKRYDFQEEPELESDEDEVGEGLAKMRKGEKEARALEEEEKAIDAIGAIPPTLAVPRRERGSGGDEEGGKASGVDPGSFRRLMSDAGAEEFVRERGIGGRRRRVDIGGRNTSISGPFSGGAASWGFKKT